MKLFRIKIIFTIVYFLVGIFTIASVWKSNRVSSLPESFSDANEERSHPSQINNLTQINNLSEIKNLSEVSNQIVQVMSAAATEKYCTGNQSLPELIFVAGIEGSGHHLISVFFDSLAKKVRPKPYHVVDYSPMFNLLDPGDVVSNQKMGFGIIRKRLFRNRLSPLLKKMNEIKKGGGRGMMVAANSFPMGLSALTTARPDLLILKYFDCVLYRLKIIVTKRHPLLAVTSTLRRFGKKRFAPFGNRTVNPFPPEDNPYIMQARITEDQLIYLDQQVRRFSCDQIHFVNMEKILSNQTRRIELKSVAKFLNLNNEETSVFLNATVRAPVTQINLPPDCANCTNKVLYEFFEDRKDMWPLMV